MEKQALSMSILKRILDQDELNNIINKYETEKENTKKKYGVFCPHCGKKLKPIKK